jgi:uncharacterized protein (TIGR03000 family)
MIPRMLALLVFLVPAIAGAEDIAYPGIPQAPVAAVGPAFGPCVGYWGPRHWIYDYLPDHDSLSERYGVGSDYLNRRDDTPNGLKSYPGRSSLGAAVPYSDYLALQRRLQAATPPAPSAPAAPAAPAPLTSSADRAILEFSFPTEMTRLWLDGQPVDGDGKTRLLQTPTLVAGKEYKFAVKATWPSSDPFHDNTMEQIVTFRAGDRKTIEIRAKN